MSEQTASIASLSVAISRFVLSSPANRLEDFDGQAIFSAPIVGVADGDDPIFRLFRAVVSPEHVMPRDLLERHTPRKHGRERVSVVAWALPFSAPVRASNATGGWPSRLYSAARNNGEALNDDLRREVVRLLQGDGRSAIAPPHTAEYRALRAPDHVFTSTWSERHVAFAAGLGRFGLNGGLITRAGQCVRLGSVVTDAPLEPSRRPGASHKAPCLDNGGDRCGRCATRCPAGAITPHGLDKEKCYAMRNAIRERALLDYTRSLRLRPLMIVKGDCRETGHSLGCALCMCGVPCEDSWPWEGEGETHA